MASVGRRSEGVEGTGPEQNTWGGGTSGWLGGENEAEDQLWLAQTSSSWDPGSSDLQQALELFSFLLQSYCIWWSQDEDFEARKESEVQRTSVYLYSGILLVLPTTARPALPSIYPLTMNC